MDVTFGEKTLFIKLNQIIGKGHLNEVNALLVITGELIYYVNFF